ncbi:MAG: PAS domain-containing protein [Pseudomonadota bacterium]
MGQTARETDDIADDFRFLSAPAHPMTARLVAYWHEKCQGRPRPERSDIVPRDILQLLPNTVIYDVLDGGADFRVRVFGTALVELVGEERTGMRVSEFGGRCNPPTNADAVRRRWMNSMSMCYETGAPAYVTGLMSSSRRSFITFHGVSCPLGNENGKPAHMFGLMVPEL